jgi:methyltransferase-like protein 6
MFDSNRCHPFCCDVVNESLENVVPSSSVDIATLIFCLSAIHPDKMATALLNIYKVRQ